MHFELYFRTYSTFGPNASLALANRWLRDRLKTSYGGAIQSVIVEACCKNRSPTKKSLETLNERFELFLKELPQYEVREKGTDLRICYYAIKYTHEELDRDRQVLSLKTFQNHIAKAAQLLRAVPEIKCLVGFDAALLASDLEAARASAPTTLFDLASLYVSYPVSGREHR